MSHTISTRNHTHFRLRLSLAFGLLVALVCIQAGFAYWGANRINDYAQHSRLASDIQSELLGAVG